MKHFLPLALFFAFTLTPFKALADDKCKGGNCPPPLPPPKTVCFNVVCTYKCENPKGGEFSTCQAAAKFEKWVTGDGDEIRDDSQYPDNPEFEVACDDQVLYNNSGRRFTDEQGTRIQAEEGPYPAILIPRGSLREGHHYVLSALELFNQQQLQGYCYVYTGAP